MSFLKKLFGGAAEPRASAPISEVEHEGYHIAATPIREGAQYRLAATISREIGGEKQEHRLIRADLFSSAEDAADAAVRKAKLVISEQGERMFN